MDIKSNFDILKINEISLEKGNLKKILDLRKINVEEIYSSDIEENQIKGWKKHNKQTSRLFCISGEVDFFLKNDNDDSLVKISLIKNDNKILIIYPGNWYAFRGNSCHNTIMNFASHYHENSESEVYTLNKKYEEDIENKVVKVFN